MNKAIQFPLPRLRRPALDIVECDFASPKLAEDELNPLCHPGIHVETSLDWFKIAGSRSIPPGSSQKICFLE